MTSSGSGESLQKSRRKYIEHVVEMYIIAIDSAVDIATRRGEVWDFTDYWFSRRKRRIQKTITPAPMYTYFLDNDIIVINYAV